MGSTALHLCYVATGALAFVHDQRASLWDIAGAAPVVIEAGGILTAERGAPLFPLDPDGYAGELPVDRHPSGTYSVCRDDPVARTDPSGGISVGVVPVALPNCQT